MLNNLHLAAITKQAREYQVFQIPLHQEIQEDLAETWQIQYEEFADGVQEIPFNAGFKPEADQRFVLNDFVLPEWLADENSQNVSDLDELNRNENMLSAIKGLVSFVRNGQNEELMLFQNFTRSHVIKPGRFILLTHNTYKGVRHPGLTLDKKLSAAYLPAERKLFFHNFRTVNTFLPLADFYEEASENEIREVLSHELLAPEDSNELAVDANQWFRKRFAMLKNSGILDHYTAKQIVDHSEGYEIDIQRDGDKIVFPAEKSEAKRLLQFLNEEIYRGAITDTLYETNSKREADV